MESFQFVPLATASDNLPKLVRKVVRDKYSPIVIDDGKGHYAALVSAKTLNLIEKLEDDYDGYLMALISDKLRREDYLPWDEVKGLLGLDKK